MEILNVIPRGFCKGVVRAIEIAKDTARKNPGKKITILGELVHNRFVVESLKDFGIDTIEDKSLSRMELLEKIDEGIVIFSAHGIGADVVNRAKAKGLITVDAACEDVVHTQELIRTYLDDGFDILYIGQRRHPEAEAVLSIDPIRIHLVQTLEDALAFESLTRKLFVTNQTTMSQFDIRQLMETIEQRFPYAVVSDEICNATRMRQEAILRLEDVDCLVVVGDIRSNNTAMLVKIGHARGIPRVYRIESATELPLAQFKDSDRIAVTAGASTPYFLIKQVVETLQALANHEDISHIEANPYDLLG
ncbi:MAG: 4-hydroxy-3-methylbut-2-enyl diphosphate reductase [Erysipelotrichales bacterium]|nr:MAG: 4-hydroxy-3-methylbut-2-enyl diphosphate reductase [Erysipelotrichales bacterium]